MKITLKIKLSFLDSDIILIKGEKHPGAFNLKVYSIYKNSKLY